MSGSICFLSAVKMAGYKKQTRTLQFTASFTALSLALRFHQSENWCHCSLLLLSLAPKAWTETQAPEEGPLPWCSSLGKDSMMHLMTFAAQARPDNPGTSFPNFCYNLYATVDLEMLMLYPSLSEMMTLGQKVESKKTPCGLLFLSYGRSSYLPHLQALLSSQGGSLIVTNLCRLLGSFQEHSWLQWYFF